jgi:hypothetical protein
MPPVLPISPPPLWLVPQVLVPLLVVRGVLPMLPRVMLRLTPIVLLMPC